MSTNRGLSSQNLELVVAEFDDKIEQKNNLTDRSPNTRLENTNYSQVGGWCWLVGDKLQNKLANFLPCLVLTGGSCGT